MQRVSIRQPHYDSIRLHAHVPRISISDIGFIHRARVLQQAVHGHLLRVTRSSWSDSATTEWTDADSQRRQPIPMLLGW